MIPQKKWFSHVHSLCVLLQMSLGRKCRFGPTLSGLCPPAASPRPQAEIGTLLLKISPNLLLWGMAESSCSEKRLEEWKKEKRTSLHPGWLRLWGAMVTIFTFFCFSLPLRMVYQDLLDCAGCFQSPVNALVSISVAFFHADRNDGRSQCISIFSSVRSQQFPQIQLIKLNPNYPSISKAPINLFAYAQTKYFKELKKP